MNVEMSEHLRQRAAAHAALGEPVRLAIVDELALSDASPSELGARLGIGSNLLAHHLQVLQSARLVQRVRSEGDRRRTYVQLLTDALPGLVPEVTRTAPRVVFVCTHNSARSQLASALWRRRSRVPVASAGTRPAARVHPGAAATARRHRLALAGARTAHVRDVLRPGDLVVAVCDSAYEDPALEPDDCLHWAVPDPVRRASPAAFEVAFHELAGRVERLASAVRTEPRRSS